MDDPFRPLELILVTVAGWVSRRQQRVIEYLVEETRVLREQLGGSVPRLNDDQRRRLAAKGQALGRRALAEVATIVTPDNRERNHQGIGNELIDGHPSTGLGDVRSTDRLGGILRYYHRAA